MQKNHETRRKIEEFCEQNITEIYDLKKDILETKNIKLFRNNEIKEMINALKNRYYCIKKVNDDWINSQN